MLASWKINAGGQEHLVSIDSAPNQKHLVRVNSRIAAKPIGPDESERGISVGGVPYIVRRIAAESYELIPDDPMMAAERTRDSARAVLAHAEQAPLPLARSVRSFAPLLGWAAVVVVIGAMMLYATGDGYATLAGKRVNQILGEMQSGDWMKMQFAVSVWAKNRRSLDRDEMAWASDHFDSWLREKDLYQKAFTRWEILDSQEIDGATPPTAIVTFKIEDREYKVRVPKDLPISWEP